MSSGDIKEELVNLHKGTNLADWKRVSEKKVAGLNVRIFQNAATGAEVTAVEIDENDGVCDLYETGPDSPMLFYVANEQLYGDECEEGETFVMFAPKKFWERNHYIPDWHMEWYLENVLGLASSPLQMEELSENSFMAYDTLENTKAALEALGMVFEPEMARAGQWEE